MTPDEAVQIVARTLVAVAVCNIEPDWETDAPDVGIYDWNDIVVAHRLVTSELHQQLRAGLDFHTVEAAFKLLEGRADNCTFDDWAADVPSAAE